MRRRSGPPRLAEAPLTALEPTPPERDSR